MTEQIFDGLVRDARHDWDAFRSHLPHRRYHDPDAVATPAPEAPVSMLTSVENEIHALADHAKKIAEEVLPAAAADVAKLEGNPVAAALLSATHVPAEALPMVVDVIQRLEELYKPETDSPAPAAPADPAMGSQPEPAPATA